MTDTIIKIDLNKSPYEHDNIHNRWHPDIPMVSTVNPGDDFIVECMDWTGGQIKNNNDASDVRDVDLDQVCVFRSIRPPVPITSGHLNRGIRPPVACCIEASIFIVS